MHVNEINGPAQVAHLIPRASKLFVFGGFSSKMLTCSQQGCVCWAGSLTAGDFPFLGASFFSLAFSPGLAG